MDVLGMNGPAFDKALKAADRHQLCSMHSALAKATENGRALGLSDDRIAELKRRKCAVKTARDLGAEGPATAIVVPSSSAIEGSVSFEPAAQVAAAA